MFRHSILISLFIVLGCPVSDAQFLAPVFPKAGELITVFCTGEVMVMGDLHVTGLDSRYTSSPHWQMGASLHWKGLDKDRGQLVEGTAQFSLEMSDESDIYATKWGTTWVVRNEYRQIPDFHFYRGERSWVFLTETGRPHDMICSFK